jgi:hypothetical protein
MYLLACPFDENAFAIGYLLFVNSGGAVETVS